MGKVMGVPEVSAVLEVQGQENRVISPLLSSHNSRAHSHGTQPGNTLDEEEP